MKPTESFSYWENEKEFRRQSNLLTRLYAEQEAGYDPNKPAEVSIRELAARQRAEKIGCLYLAGGRIDNKACLGSRHVGMLYSSLPTDYIKAIVPAFHSGHDELLVCTDGQVIVEYSTSLGPHATVETIILNPGEYFIAKSKWPHRISLAPIRMLLNLSGSATDNSKISQVFASFLSVKMGFLSGKSIFEDMAQWPPKYRHPIISNWQDDDAFLTKIRQQRDLCEKLHILPLES